MFAERHFWYGKYDHNYKILHNTLYGPNIPSLSCTTSLTPSQNNFNKYEQYARVSRKQFCTSENLNTAHLTLFVANNIILVFSTCKHKKNGYCVPKTPVLNASFKYFWSTNINNHLICFEKKINTYLKAKISYIQHEFLASNTYLSSF